MLNLFGVEVSGFGSLLSTSRERASDLEFATSGFRGANGRLVGLELDADISIFAALVQAEDVLDLTVFDVGFGFGLLPLGGKLFLLPVETGFLPIPIPVPVGVGVSVFGVGGGASVGSGGQRIPPRPPD